MKSAIISVGTEILFGQITNTNVVFLSKKLNSLGIDVMYHFTVGDNPKRLQEVLEYALKHTDLVITTGGLGPTQDDLTKEIIAQTLGDDLQLHQPSFDKINEFFIKIGKEMSENNKKQAYLPKTGVVLPNDFGTAPGFALEKDNKCVICLPGPPREMTHMFNNYAYKYLESKSSDVIYSKMLRFFGIGESELETRLLDLISNQTNPTLATYAKEGEVCLRVTAKTENIDEAKVLVNKMIEKIDSILKEYIYSYDDEELIDVVTNKLIEKNISISLAESCTGGLIASRLTDISGISKIFDRGIVTYSNKAKVEELGVKEETLDKFGAVSEEIALEMVKGLKNVTGSDICVSVTGIAGPTGGTEEKPVGLIYVGLIYKEEVICKKFQLRGNRGWNRNYIVLAVLNMINNKLKSK